MICVIIKFIFKLYIFKLLIIRRFGIQEWCVESENDDDEECSYIPVEEVQAFRKQQQHYNEQRLQLRNDLRLKFDRLCGRVSNDPSQSN